MFRYYVCVYSTALLEINECMFRYYVCVYRTALLEINECMFRYYVCVYRTALLEINEYMFRYYVCVYRTALLEICSGGLVFSQQLQTCDWPRYNNKKKPCQRSENHSTVLLDSIIFITYFHLYSNRRN